MKREAIIEDIRPITRLLIGENFSYSVGDKYNPISNIVPYHEAGEMSYIVWFEVYNGEEIIARINSKFVSQVIYK